MQIPIIDPIFSTKIIIIVLCCALLLSLRPKNDKKIFPAELTQELKGLAILAVVFSHVGYFLATDQRFLFPLSIMAGVGVDLFLFLSGYGLTVSTLKQKLPVLTFYKKRLLKLFTPIWIVLLLFLTLDYFLLHISYSLAYIIRSLFGFFPRADLFLDINSPLWFITALLFFYLLFPVVFSKKYPWLTAMLLLAASYFVLKCQLPVSDSVLNLYELHYAAFPLGVAFASLIHKSQAITDFVTAKIKISKALQHLLKFLYYPAYVALMIGLLFVIGYTANYSGVGLGPAVIQRISLTTMGAILLFFMLKKFESRLLYIFGFYSYEIYLLHWPLMARYDLFFRWLPGWLAMMLYLILLLILGWGMRKIVDQFLRKKVVRAHDGKKVMQAAQQKG